MNSGQVRRPSNAFTFATIVLAAAGLIAAVVLTRATGPFDPDAAALRVATDGASRSLYDDVKPPESTAVFASPASRLSGGIPEARAIELARSHASFTNLVSASAGLFRDLNIQAGVGPGYPIKPDHSVWAVAFSGEVTICGPVANCFSPRPGINAVYLDYLTGDFLSSATNAPAP